MVRDHVDPKKGSLVCGLDTELNYTELNYYDNSRKNNKFVPYRVCGFPAPKNFGDTCEFLIEDQWVVCEFGGELWETQAKKNGTGPSAPASDKQKEVAAKTGRRNHESGRLQKQASSGGKKASKLKVGLHSPDSPLSDWGKKGGAATAAQKWECTETGMVLPAGLLTIWQKKKNIDTSKRKRLT